MKFWSKIKQYFKNAVTETIEVVFIKRHETILTKLEKGSREASGYDLIAYLGYYEIYSDTNTSHKKEVAAYATIAIPPHGRILVPTGIRLALPEHIEAIVRPRSGLTLKTGLIAQIGTIDSDYRGEVKVTLVNTTNKVIYINVNDRIAQLVYQYKVPINHKSVSFLPVSHRGENGFGSTGK